MPDVALAQTFRLTLTALYLDFAGQRPWPRLLARAVVAVIRGCRTSVVPLGRAANANPALELSNTS